MNYCAVMGSMGQCLYWQQDQWVLWSVGDVKSPRSLLMIWWYLMGAFEQAMHQWMGLFATWEALESLEEMWQAVVTPVSWQWQCQSPMWDASRKSQHGTSQKAVEKEISGRDDFVTVFFGGFYENFMDTHGISAYLGGYVVRKKMRETIFFTGWQLLFVASPLAWWIASGEIQHFPGAVGITMSYLVCVSLLPLFFLFFLITFRSHLRSQKLYLSCHPFSTPFGLSFLMLLMSPESMAVLPSMVRSRAIGPAQLHHDAKRAGEIQAVAMGSGASLQHEHPGTEGDLFWVCSRWFDVILGFCQFGEAGIYGEYNIIFIYI